MLHDPIDLEQGDPILSLPRLRPLPNPDLLPDRIDSRPSGTGGGVTRTSAPPVPAALPTTPPEPLTAEEAILAEILALRTEQALRFGHTVEQDAALEPVALPARIRAAAKGALDYAQFHKLDLARRYLVKTGALTVAAIAALDARTAAEAAEWPELGE